MGSAGARRVRVKRAPRQRVQAGRPQSLQFGGSRLCAFGFVPIRGQQEHMPRDAVVVRACSFTENDDIGAVQVCRASRCSSAFWTVGVCRDLFSGVPQRASRMKLLLPPPLTQRRPHCAGLEPAGPKTWPDREVIQSHQGRDPPRGSSVVCCHSSLLLPKSLRRNPDSDVQDFSRFRSNLGTVTN